MSAFIKTGIVEGGRLLIDAADLPGLRDGGEVRVRVEVLPAEEEAQSEAGDAFRRVRGHWKNHPWPNPPEELIRDPDWVAS